MSWLSNSSFGTRGARSLRARALAKPAVSAFEVSSFGATPGVRSLRDRGRDHANATRAGVVDDLFDMSDPPAGTTRQRRSRRAGAEDIVDQASGAVVSADEVARAVSPGGPLWITVFTKPKCIQSDATFRALAHWDLPFATCDISNDAEALESVKALGYQQAPVVFVNGVHWSGFRPDLIRAIAKSQQEISQQEIS